MTVHFNSDSWTTINTWWQSGIVKVKPSESDLHIYRKVSLSLVSSVVLELLCTPAMRRNFRQATSQFLWLRVTATEKTPHPHEEDENDDDELHHLVFLGDPFESFRFVKIWLNTYLMVFSISVARTESYCLYPNAHRWGVFNSSSA